MVKGNVFADVKRIELCEPAAGGDDHSVAALQFVLKPDSSLRCHPLVHTPAGYGKREVREESVFAIVLPAKSSALATITNKVRGCRVKSEKL